VEYSQFDRRPAYSQPDADRRGPDRRGGLRRESDRQERMREIAAFVFAFCGGLAVLYVFFVVLGTIAVGDAAIATGLAVALALVWLYGYWRRLRSGAATVQRPDRERRGF
jgi:hypothetical protein